MSATAPSLLGRRRQGETAKPEREAEQRAIDDASAGSLPKSIWNDLGKLIIEAGAEPQHYLMCRRKAVFHGYHADGTTRMDETLTSSPSLCSRRSKMSDMQSVPTETLGTPWLSQKWRRRESNPRFIPYR